jgi:uncharacterized protein
LLIPVVVIVLLLALLGAGYYFARVLIYPNIFPVEETYRQDLQAGRFTAEDYAAWPTTELKVRSPYGYDLAAIYHPLPGSQRTVVLSHGITWSRVRSMTYAMPFYRRGFNVLIYDLRHHGNSGGPNTSFGYYEKDDLKVMVDWALAQLGPGGRVGTFGESLGAATTLQHAAIDPRIAFAVADCSFSDFPTLLRFRLREDYKVLPAFPLLNLAQFFTRLLAGWSFEQASPLPLIPRIQTPVFFIHGQKDTYVPTKMAQELYAAKQQGIRKLYIAPNAGHAETLLKNPVEYDQQMGEFLNEIGLVP